MKIFTKGHYQALKKTSAMVLHDNLGFLHAHALMAFSSEVPWEFMFPYIIPSSKPPPSCAIVPIADHETNPNPHSKSDSSLKNKTFAQVVNSSMDIPL